MTNANMSNQIATLSADFTTAARAASPALRGVVQQGISQIKDRWQANARATAGKHGRLYPASITYETRALASGIIGEVGPDSSRPQGGMGLGFELGSSHQPPHLDGLKAVDGVGPQLERDFHTAIEGLVP